MRTIKLIVLGLVAVFLIVVGVANNTPVDLHLLPVGLVGDRYTLTGIPLSPVLLAAVLLGAFFGLALEWFRERKERAAAREQRREAAELREEIARLRRQVKDENEGLPRLRAS